MWRAQGASSRMKAQAERQLRPCRRSAIEQIFVEKLGQYSFESLEPPQCEVKVLRSNSFFHGCIQGASILSTAKLDSNHTKKRADPSRPWQNTMAASLGLEPRQRE